MEEQEDGWLTVLEKNGLGPVVAIFENYGIDSETDLLVLDPDDFNKLSSRGLKPLHVKNLQLWSVCEREKNMLPNTPTVAELLSSEALNVVTPAAHSVDAEESECESGAENYWKQTIEDKKGDQLERMKAVRIFNPMHVLGNKISESDIDGLKIFKFYDHPEIRAEIEVMKTEVMKYQALVGSIKSFEERKDNKGKDTFVLSDWWKSNCATLPGFAYVLRAVLTNSPNSYPPERLFNIFNATYGDDQKNSHTDYIELSIQSQFNKRGLR